MVRFLILLLCLIPLSTKAQFLEFGGGIGASNYTGDLNSSPRLLQSKLAGTAIYRMNFSDVLSVRFSATAGNISGNDENPVDVLGELRDQSFNHLIIEGSMAFEYHFLSYRSEKERNKFAPYAMLGFGFANVRNVERTYQDFNNLQPVVPMGGGVKYLLSKRLTLTGELGARRTFFDYLDGISDNDITIKSSYQFGNPNDQDWYFFSTLTLTYVLYKIPCPFGYVPNRSIFNRIHPYR